MFLKFPLFYPPNKEIQSGKTQSNFEFFLSGFPYLDDKRAGILKFFLLLRSLPYFYAYPGKNHLYLSFSLRDFLRLTSSSEFENS